MTDAASDPGPAPNPRLRTARHGRTVVLTLDHPPVNGLGLATRQALADGLRRADADPSVDAVVLMGAGRLFSGGADIREFGSPQALQSPNLHDLIAQVEDAVKPVIAAVHGSCVGGGLELSLGCHYRIAVAGTAIALPEVRLGLVPGAGGTQRLPRAIGVEAALRMIVPGASVAAERLAAAPDQRLFQHVVEAAAADTLLQAALAFAATVAGARPLPRLRDLPVDAPMAALVLREARRQLQASGKATLAAARCIDAVEAAVTLPIDDGLRAERAIFLALVATPESRAMRHAFFAERAAAKVADVPDGTVLRPLRQVAVIGAGTMGSGIAQCVLNAGLPVVLLDADAAALARGVAAVARSYAARQAKGRLTAQQVAERMALLRPTLDIAEAADADLAIEAVVEDMAVKQRVFAALDAVLRPGAILASNTSTLDLDQLAAATGRPADVVGLHFFSPAPVMRLLEVVRGRATAADVLATALRLARTLGKTAVVARVCDGFIGNRMLEQYVRQAFWLVEEGAAPQQVDRAVEAYGFAMGPFRMSDLAGNDVSQAIRRRRAAERPQLRYSGLPDELCALGRYGQKTGAGWYDYADGGRDALPSPVVDALIDRHRAALGLLPRAIGDEEIVQRLLYALVNEGAQLLDDGIAARASDVDLVYLAGYGFPPQRGGPLHAANEAGLEAVVQTMRRFAANPHGDPGFWQPAPLLARLAASGQRFA